MNANRESANRQYSTLLVGLSEAVKHCPTSSTVHDDGSKLRFALLNKVQKYKWVTQQAIPWKTKAGIIKIILISVIIKISDAIFATFKFW